MEIAKKLSNFISLGMAILSAGAVMYYFAIGDQVLGGIYLCLTWIVMLHLKE